jgi:hypothetical protein
LAKTRLRLPGGATPCGHEFLHLRGCFRPTKWQGNRGGGIKEIEPAEPNHASDACIAALRAPSDVASAKSLTCTYRSRLPTLPARRPGSGGMCCTDVKLSIYHHTTITNASRGNVGHLRPRNPG